jgi:hypothetical protein
MDIILPDAERVDNAGVLTLQPVPKESPASSRMLTARAVLLAKIRGDVVTVTLLVCPSFPVDESFSLASIYEGATVETAGIGVTMGVLTDTCCGDPGETIVYGVARRAVVSEDVLIATLIIAPATGLAAIPASRTTIFATAEESDGPAQLGLLKVITISPDASTLVVWVQLENPSSNETAELGKFDVNGEPPPASGARVIVLPDDNCWPDEDTCISIKMNVGTRP